MLQPARWPVVAACLVVSFFAALGLSAPAAAQTYEAEELEVVRLINEYRQQNGLEPLLISDALSRAAERHSEDMGRYGFFSHITQASSYYPVGADHTVRAAQEGYDYDTATAENLAYGQTTAQAVFEAWRTSPEHNANMLGDYRVVGVGLVWVAGTPYWTTVFGGYVDPSAAPAGAAQQTPGGAAGGATQQERSPAPTTGPEKAAPAGEPVARESRGEKKSAPPAPARTPASAAAGQYADRSGEAPPARRERQEEPREARAQYVDPSREQSAAPPPDPAAEAPERRPAREEAGPSGGATAEGDAAPGPEERAAGSSGGDSALGIAVLPDTGGPGLGALAAGALLAAGGLLRLRR
ncbi:Allergen V5/Tpx-1 related [Rubrobacter xylanophilus DSM 9941]|uniref:Allergen V5/Tpx-1 related n=1 Tax=Rubrobacter xylanophilus (strain DSM 9941 / JCM 11954 / NBRC 16129 / PRD-1) TaxID=266117 RepID=Q1AXH7_RUBXD|nr:CAP domain-containing protein [Rubrobacter xylanophilus]ABG03901.1 Allergen V5/Tpx-1 related [Rubrobacter xylanophilus DSM 9941]